MTAEKPSGHDQEVTADAPRQSKYALDAQKNFEAALGILPYRDWDIEIKRAAVLAALVEKKDLEAINSYNLDVVLEREGETDADIPPVAIDILPQEVADIRRICGESLLTRNLTSLRDQVVRAVYYGLGAQYPYEVGHTPGEDEMKSLPIDNRLDRTTIRVIETPSSYSPFVFQRIGVVTSDNELDPGAVIHRFIKSDTQISRPSGTRMLASRLVHRI